MADTPPTTDPGSPPPQENPSEDAGPDLHSPAVRECLRKYWRSNVRIMSVLLVIWAIAGLGCGVLFADVLNEYKIGGFPLGFWFAQQGSIIVFVFVILVYCILLNRLDKKHHDELQQLRNGGEGK